MARPTLVLAECYDAPEPQQNERWVARTEPGSETVVATGSVVWATETDAFSLDVGLEFIEIDPAALELLDKIAGIEA